MVPKRTAGLLRLDSTRHCRHVGRPRTRTSSRHLMLSVVSLWLIWALPVAAQGPGVESYGVPHLFSLPTATTARQFGMGGVSTCVRDVGFPNPAFAGDLDGQQGGLRGWRTDFDGDGMQLTAWQAWYATPIGEGEGIQVLGVELDSDRGAVAVGPGQALPGAISETDAAVHYGRRLSDRWLVGGGVAPVLHSSFNLFTPDGIVAAHADSTATFGFRLGALYQWAPEGYAGFVFDRYNEDVSFRAGAAPPMDFDFTSTEWALGISGRVSERVFAAAEWMALESEDGDVRSKTDGLHFGVEVTATDALDLRAGLNDGSLSLGAGYAIDGWVVNYAWIDDWNDDAVGAALGGSDTHQLEIGRYW